MVSIVRTMPGGFGAAVAALGWRRTGAGEAHGPCPACGGRDRAWLRPHRGGGERVVLSCRQCESWVGLAGVFGRLAGPGFMPDWRPPPPPRKPRPDPARVWLLRVEAGQALDAVREVGARYAARWGSGRMERLVGRLDAWRAATAGDDRSVAPAFWLAEPPLRLPPPD